MPHSRSLQLVSRLLLRFLPRLSGLTILPILLNPLPPFSLRSQLSSQYEIGSKFHHSISSRYFISEEILLITLAKFRLEVIHVFLYVNRRALFGLRFITVLLKPTNVQDSEGVESEGGFGGMNPLEDGVAFWITHGWQEAVLFVVRIAEVSDNPSGFPVSLLGVERADLTR